MITVQQINSSIVYGHQDKRHRSNDW